MSDIETQRKLFETTYKATPTDETLHVLEVSGEEALRFQHPYIGTEHLLLALIQETQTKPIFESLELTLNKARSNVEFIIGRGDRPVTTMDLGLTLRAKRVLDLSVDEARMLKDSVIIPDHLLLSLIREGEGIAVGILEASGASLIKTRTVVLRTRADRQRLQQFDRESHQPENQPSLQTETPVMPKSLEGLAAFLINPQSDTRTKVHVERMLASLTDLITPQP